jgi:signal transduction histidine kinase
LIKLSADGIRPVAEGKSITLEYESAGEEMWIFGDSDRVQQIVNNLLSNALKFTPEGGSVALVLENSDGNARISVRDTGQGIAPEFLPRVFERYKQANNSTTNRKGGLGLGLAIVKHLVELHGGSIAAESDGDGKGSTFVVTIPLATAVMEQGTETAAA